MNKTLINEKRFFYNENLRLILAETIDAEGDVKYRESIEYDDKNRITKVNINDDITIPNFIKTKEYYYGEPNNDKSFSIVESIETTENDLTNITNCMIEVDYDIDALIERTTINGDLYRLKSYDTNENLVYERLIKDEDIFDFYYMYNKDNKLIMKIMNDEIVEEIHYDESGRIIEHIKRICFEMNECTVRTKYKYDDQNRIVEQLIENNTDKKKIVYKYLKSTQISSYYTIGDDGNEIHDYDDVKLSHGDNKRIYATPSLIIEEEYDSNNNIIKIAEYRIN